MTDKKQKNKDSSSDKGSVTARAEAMAKLYEQHGDKELSAKELEKIAGKHADKETLKLMQKAQALNAKGELAMDDVADIAAEIGGKAGLSETQQKLLKTLGGELDKDEVAKIPGVVVDKETGSISVMGLINLDANDPTSQLIAKGIAAAYSALAINVNEIGYKKAYELSSKNAAKFDLTRASNHRIGMAAATGLVGAVSFWPSITSFVQMEKQGRKDTMKLASQFAPLLGDYGKSGSRVSQLYQIRPEDNEVIYNERRRMGMQHNAERFRLGVDTLISRVPLFATSIIRGQAELAELKKEAEAAAEIAKKQLANEDPEKATIRLIKEKADLYKNELNLTQKEAVDMAREEIKSGGVSKPPSDKERKGGFWNQMNRDAVNGAVVLAPVLGDMISRNLFNQRLKERGFQTISAADMMFHLRDQLNDNPKSDRFSLPKGMTVEGSKGGNNQVRLEEYIEQIFEQHERDCSGDKAKIPARYDEALHAASKLIADALREGHLDGIALVKLVGERKIVRPAGKTVAPEEIVSAEIDRLEQEMRHVEFTDNKQYFEESSFTPQELKASWDGMDQEERAVFANMVPQTVLESVGVNSNELQTMREQREDYFYQDLHYLVKGLLELGDDTLKQLGVTRAESSMFHQIEKVVDQKGEQAIGQEMKRNLGQITHAITNSLIAHQTQHQGRINDVMKPKEAKKAANNDNIRAANDNKGYAAKVAASNQETGRLETKR